MLAPPLQKPAQCLPPGCRLHSLCALLPLIAGACLPAAARLEAVIDFGEDEGIADDVAAGVAPQVQALRRELQRHLAAAVGGELVR